MTGHVFVDESRQRDYLLVAAVVTPGNLTVARRSLRALVMPGQRRLHMKKESDATVAGHRVLVLKQEASPLWWDRQHLIEIARDVGCRDTLRYEHRRAEQEVLLAVPDAVAWCWAKGGQRRDRVQPVVTEVRVI